MNPSSIQLEARFQTLPVSEKTLIISHGAALRLAQLRQRLFLAESKVRHFETKYATDLSVLDSQGLPDDAGYEFHEDYILWHHWQEVVLTVSEQIAALEGITSQGILSETMNVGY